MDLHTLLGSKATLADKDFRKGGSNRMGSRKARHQPKANCNYIADFGIISLRGTFMSFKSLLGLNVRLLDDCIWLYFELLYCCCMIYFASF